jgi:DNA-binding NarL/FixJ family response regulator
VRILIADDHPVVRRGVCSILESRKDLIVCGEARNGEEAIQKAAELKPDLVILDVTMPVLDGLSAAKRIIASTPLPILILSMHAGEEIVRLAKSAGARGYINKVQIAESLLKAVDTLMAGGTFFPSANSWE